MNQKSIYTTCRGCAYHNTFDTFGYCELYYSLISKIPDNTCKGPFEKKEPETEFSVTRIGCNTCTNRIFTRNTNGQLSYSKRGFPMCEHQKYVTGIPGLSCACEISLMFKED